MIKKLFLIPFILFSLISLPVWSNAVDGKGLICKKIEDNKKLMGIQFGKDKVTYFYMNFEYDKVKVVKIREKYLTDIKNIKWGDGRFRLNRKKLEIEYNSPFEEKYVPFANNCRLFNDTSTFNLEWDNLKKKAQEDYDSQLKGNKL
ncbi:MAG: hypothetical protein ACJ0BU_00165 [Candidatus Puniceispirillales bacterium]